MYCGLPVRITAVGEGREAKVLFERAGEVTLVEEPRFQRDLHDAVAGIPQLRGGPGEPQAARVGPDRDAVTEAEDPGQVHRVHADLCGDVGQPQVLPEPVVQQRPGLPQPARRAPFRAEYARLPEPGGQGQQFQYQPLQYPRPATRSSRFHLPQQHWRKVHPLRLEH